MDTVHLQQYNNGMYTQVGAQYYRYDNGILINMDQPNLHDNYSNNQNLLASKALQSMSGQTVQILLLQRNCNSIKYNDL